MGFGVMIYVRSISSYNYSTPHTITQYHTVTWYHIHVPWYHNTITRHRTSTIRYKIDILQVYRTLYHTITRHHTSTLYHTITRHRTITLDIIQLLYKQSLEIIQVLDIIKTLQKYNVLTTYKYWSRIGFRSDPPSLKIIFFEKIWNVSGFHPRKQVII